MMQRNTKNLVYRIFLLILIVGMHAEYQFGSFGFFGSNMQYSSVEFVIGFATLFLCGYILYKRIPPRELFKEKVLFYILLSFCLSLLLSTASATYKVEAVKYDIRIMSNIALFYLLLQFLFKEKLTQISLIVLNLVGITVSLICVLRCLDLMWVNKAFSYWGQGGSRLPYSASVFQHNNVFGNWLVLLILITLGQFMKFPSKMYRIWLCSSLGLFTLSLALSFSRSAWVAFLVTGSLFILIRKRYKRVIIGAVALMLLFLVVIIFHPIGRKRIIDHTIHKSWELKFNEASSDRKIFYQSAALMIKQYPVFGIGLNNFKNRYHEFINAPPNVTLNAHNQYLNILAEQGLLGFFIFMVFVAYLIRLAISNIKKGGNEFYALAIFAYLIGALFDYLWYDYSFIFMFWFVVILNLIEKRDLELKGFRDSGIEELGPQLNKKEKAFHPDGINRKIDSIGQAG